MVDIVRNTTKSKPDVRTHGYGTKTIMPAYAAASNAIGPSLWAHYNADLLTPLPSAAARTSGLTRSVRRSVCGCVSGWTGVARTSLVPVARRRHG